MSDLPIKARWQDWYNERATECFRDSTPLHEIHCETTAFGFWTATVVIGALFAGLWWCFYHALPAPRDRDGRAAFRLVSMLPAFALTFAFAMLFVIAL